MRNKRIVAISLSLLLLLASLTLGAQIQSTRDATAAFVKEVSILASAARTATGDSGAPVDLAAYNSGNIFVDVTAVSGTTPTLDIAFEVCTTAAAASCAYSHTTGTQITAVSKQVIKVTNFGRYGRVKFTIAGTTPSFTFSVDGAFKPQS